jgi:membrane protein implicated in regulation of membrane protease activity
MEDWVIWLIVAAGLGVGEMLSLSFFLAPFGIGALAGMVVALVGGGTAIALAVALVVSLVSLATLRPIARNHLRTPARLRTGTAALVGREAVVLELVTQDAGAVKLDGETWSARSYSGAPVAVGERVQVLEIRGATAYVSE